MSRLPHALAVLLLFAAGVTLVTGCANGATESAVIEGRPSGVPDDAGLRIATLNAEFLFDGLGSEGQASFPWQGDPAAARVHRDSLARVIRLLDADVLMLQEVENREALQMLIDESLSDLGYEAHFVQGKDTFTGQDVALLSRVPVEEVGRTDERAPVGTSRQDYGVSKNMWARLSLDGVPTTLIGVHFLARPDDLERRPRREAQAEVIRRLVEQEHAAGRAVAVLGDFNDFDPDVPDRAGSAPITDVLEIVKEAGPGPEDDLRSVLGEVPQEKRYT
ncbi:MAG: endonuclease/exonuclease/phosphatase family protein, partial [Rhodothermales bacterium]|nr:endonuclease/exonuclease/phosphatase family protein [Rhodothermales bacterium]